MSIHIDLDRHRKPGLNTHMDQAEVSIHKVEVQVQTLPSCGFDKRALIRKWLLEQKRERAAGFKDRENAHEAMLDSVALGKLALTLYHVTASFPRDETYGLVSQIRRSASSIPSNIAEGCGRDGDAELARFCTIARGSASELEYQLLLARDLKFIPPNDYEQLAQQAIEIKRMLTVLVQKLNAES